MHSKTLTGLLVLAILLLLFAGCAPNNERYLSHTAGFWAGLWHGLICVITFIISLFSDNVGVYEANNNGNWYNFGFVMGIMISLGHGGVWRPARKGFRSKCKEEKEWEEIGQKVEEKVRRGIRKWLDETEDNDTEWEEIGKKVEEKIKRELKNWAEK